MVSITAIFSRHTHDEDERGGKYSSVRAGLLSTTEGPVPGSPDSLPGHDPDSYNISALHLSGLFNTGPNLAFFCFAS